MMSSSVTSNQSSQETAIANHEKTRKAAEGSQQASKAASTTSASAGAANTAKPAADNSGVHLTLSKDALKALNEKSTAEYNKIVKDASSQSGALSDDVMKRFKANTLSQAKAASLAQANSSPQAIFALLS